jgi:hypothetical protein
MGPGTGCWVPIHADSSSRFPTENLRALSFCHNVIEFQDGFPPSDEGDAMRID